MQGQLLSGVLRRWETLGSHERARLALDGLWAVPPVIGEKTVHTCVGGLARDPVQELVEVLFPVKLEGSLE